MPPKLSRVSLPGSQVWRQVLWATCAECNHNRLLDRLAGCRRRNREHDVRKSLLCIRKYAGQWRDCYSAGDGECQRCSYIPQQDAQELARMQAEAIAECDRGLYRYGDWRGRWRG